MYIYTGRIFVTVTTIATVAAKNTIDSDGFQTIGVKRGQPVYKKTNTAAVDKGANNEVYRIHLRLKICIYTCASTYILRYGFY